MGVFSFNSLLVSHNLQNMENTKIIFQGTTTTEGQQLEVFYHSLNEIFIKIYHRETTDQSEYITLNKATAAKLVKVLQREISKIE